MVDRLRRSIEDMEPPTCPNCHIDMEWSWSAMVSREPLTIEHDFVCASCKRVQKRRSVLSRPADVPPGKLSAPAKRFRCAA